MNKLNKLTLALGISALALGCVVEDDDGGADGTGDDTAGTSMTAGNTMTMTGVDDGDDDGATGTADGGTADDTADGGTATDDGATDSGTTAVDPGPFVPDDPDPSLYTRVDKAGMPAVNTALVGMGSKDNYNAASITAGGMRPYATQRANAITRLLGGPDLDNPDPAAGLGQILIDLGFFICDPFADCHAQATGVVVPDTLRIDTSAGAAGFPNGRTLTDQVIDITLAVLLLDLTAGAPNSLTALAEVPVNPAAQTDAKLGTEFPFLADPH